MLSGVRLGDICSGSRRRVDGMILSWSFTNPEPIAGDGILPFFIAWGQAAHPATSAPQGNTLSGGSSGASGPANVEPPPGPAPTRSSDYRGTGTSAYRYHRGAARVARIAVGSTPDCRGRRARPSRPWCGAERSLLRWAHSPSPRESHGAEAGVSAWIRPGWITRIVGPSTAERVSVPVARRGSARPHE